MAIAFGVDIGGSGIKGAPVDLETGELTAERIKYETPQPSTPRAVAKVVAQLLADFGDEAAGIPIGITIPSVVARGVTITAANIDKKWINYPAADTLSSAVGRPVTLVNDADAAGLAETHYGAARDKMGLVIVTTLGTGIGTALIYDGILIPNSELGHMEIDGFEAEKRAAASVRTNEDLSWAAYTKRLQRLFETFEALFTPDLLVVGGGVSRNADKYLPSLKLKTPIVPAELRNDAGIVGAALYAYQRQ